MPYKEGRTWRGVVKIGGKRITQKSGFSRKRDAQEWERQQKKQEKLKLQQRGTALIVFCSKYLDNARHLSQKTYQEKKALIERILTAWRPNTTVEDITPEMILYYLNNRSDYQPANKAVKRPLTPLTDSHNAFNKDRKNLLRMWNWGRDILGFSNNPVKKIQKRPHDRIPQYVPPVNDILKVLAAADRKERTFLDCYLQTGARRAEIFRWTWTDDINFQAQKVRLGSRKSSDGSMKYRWLDMSDDLLKSLTWLWEHRTFKHSSYVWVDDHPGPHYGEPYKVRRRFLASICERAGVKPFGFHALRRYVASVLHDSGKVSLKKLMLILGHSTLSVTQRYIMLLDDDLKETMNLLSVPETSTPNKQGVKQNGT